MTERFVFSSFGVVVSVVVEAPGDRHLAHQVEQVLPPGRIDVRRTVRPDASFAVMRFGDRFSVYGPDVGPDRTDRVDWERAVDAVHDLDRRVRAAVSLGAPDHVFIHAGAVAGAAGALVLPGRSFVGKTTLVAALLEAGASYLSDEYAVLDAGGAVLPYARLLSLRTADGRRDVAARTLGRTAPSRPVPVALVVSTSYRPGASWAPSTGAPAACALALLDNAVAARSRSREVLAVVAAVGRSASYLHGDRADAGAAARDLLQLLGGPVPLDRPAVRQQPDAPSQPARTGVPTANDRLDASPDLPRDRPRP